MTTIKQKRQFGFTLVEVMVSLVLLALLASGVFSVLASGRYLVARTKGRFIAHEIARAEIERMRGFIDASTWDSSGGPLMANGSWSDWDATTHAPYRWRFRVDSVPGGAEYRKVTVQVGWNETKI